MCPHFARLELRTKWHSSHSIWMMIALLGRTSHPVLCVPWLMSLLCTLPLAQSLLHSVQILWTSQNLFSFWHRPHYSSLFIWRSVPERFITSPLAQGWKRFPIIFKRSGKVTQHIRVTHFIIATISLIARFLINNSILIMYWATHCSIYTATCI